MLTNKQKSDKILSLSVNYNPEKRFPENISLVNFENSGQNCWKYFFWMTKMHGDSFRAMYIWVNTYFCIQVADLRI